MNDFFGVAAGIVGIIGYIPYILDILKGQTKPDRVAWFIWALEYAALFYAQAYEGAVGSLWLIGLQLIGVIIVFSLSLRYGIGAFNRQAKLLLVCVAISLLLWLLTKSASLAILILLAVEASGVILTIRKLYKHPGSETLTMWYLIGIAGILGIPAVGLYASPILYAYPIALILMSGSVIIASLLGTKKIRVALPITE